MVVAGSSDEGLLAASRAEAAVAVPVDSCNAPYGNGTNVAWINFGNGMPSVRRLPYADLVRRVFLLREIGRVAARVHRAGRHDDRRDRVGR